MTSLASSSTEKDEKNSKNTILLTDEIYEKLENGVEVFEKHVINKEVNAEGNPWKVERDTGNIIVRYSASKTNSCRIFHVQFRVKIPKSFDLNVFISNLMDMPKRVSWDKSIKSAKTHSTYKSTLKKDVALLKEEGTQVTYELSEYTTASAAGGLVSPRWFLDARKFTTTKDGTASCFTVDASGSSLVDPESGHVIAKNYNGGASRIQRIEILEDGFEIWQSDSIAHCNIGGWLPTAIVNRETGGAMAGTYESMLLQLVESKDNSIIPTKDYNGK